MRTIGCNIEWNGSGLEEVGFIRTPNGNPIGEVQDGQELIKISKNYYRPSEVESLLGNPAKIKKLTGWEPKIGINELANEMMLADLVEYNLEGLLK